MNRLKNKLNFPKIFAILFLILISFSIFQTSFVSRANEPIQWLKNPTFTSPIEPTWYKTSGDPSDLQAIDGGNQANITVIGDKGNFSTGVMIPTNATWTAVNNTDIPINPDLYKLDAAGGYVSHLWDCQDLAQRFQQITSIRWQHQITMPVNMSDYTITSASVKAIVNATVTASPIKNGIDVLTDTGAGSEIHSGDYVKFYVLISDPANTEVYEIASNRTTELGWDATAIGGFSYMNDTLMTTLPQNVLITLLTAVLKSNCRNFTVTLGMDLYSERNQQTDVDIYDSLRIKSLNLTIYFEKKISRGSAAAWNQVGNQLPVINHSRQVLTVQSARLYFKFRIDQNWTQNSPNSELRILVNNQTLLETIPLTKANRTFQQAKPGGFDVLSYIVENVNISIALQVFLADNFELTQNITISIDDVYLFITYLIVDLTTIQGTDWLPVIYGLVAAIIGIVAAVLAYQLYFKYPPEVRKIRSIRKKIASNTKVKKPISVKTRDAIIQMKLNTQKKMLGIEMPEMGQPKDLLTHPKDMAEVGGT